MSTPRERPAPRVALVRARYNPSGGAERFVQGAIEAMQAQGAAITIVTRSWPGHDGSALVLDPFHVGSLWRDWGFARATCSALAARRFDLVQSHERIACCDVYRAGDGVHAQWLEERARIQGPVSRMFTRMNPHHRYLLAAERALFTGTRLKAVICNSDMVRREIARRFATDESKLVLIRNAVDPSAFHPGLRAEMHDAVRQQLAIPRLAKVVLHVGSGFERKGVRVLLEAIARTRSETWAIVVGRDKRSARYAGIARALGIADRVRFVGAASDVRPFYAAADVFALATLYDPQPNAMLEAMSCGLPVATTRRCGAAELLEEGVSGYIRDALDTPGFAEALDRMDLAHARTMGAAAREAVAPYTPQSMAREYLALYARLLNR